LNFLSSYKEIRLILGDQLNGDHPWFKESDETVLYVMMEIFPEATYVTHHIQKIMSIFLAMRDFAGFLSSHGHHVLYLKISDRENKQSFDENLQKLVAKFGVTHAAYQEPDEYRLDKILNEVFLGLPVLSRRETTAHFFTERFDLKHFFEGKKQYRMENFYRHMRRKYHILMDNAGQPETGRWNYDTDNRKKLPPGQKVP
jgi:deoxyribodipyrimidine photolyase-related protein